MFKTLQWNHLPAVRGSTWVWTFYDVISIVYLTIIPQAQMGSESIAHKAEGQLAYWLRGLEGERNNCFRKIQLVDQK